MVNLPQPITKQYSNLIDDISTGRLKIPQFQREFVWDLKSSARLIDSIVKGYPVGTFIFWKTKERLRSVRNIGNLNLPEPPQGDFVNFVLDGQQRITSLYASIQGVSVTRADGKTEDFSEIYVDLEAKPDESVVITAIEGRSSKELIKLKDLIFGGVTFFIEFEKKYHPKIEDYQRRIQSYNFSVIQVDEVPIEVATDIFTRINVGGKSLTLFEIMVAKTYDFEKNFDLSDRFEKLIEKLRTVDYETISSATILQTISILIKKECKRGTILKIEKEKFVDNWESAVDAIERAIDYFRGYYRIPVSQLLPYYSLIVPFAYFFYHHPDKPTGKMKDYLEDFFWRVALSGRYSSGTEGKLAQDVKRIDKILKEELPEYDWAISTNPEFIKNNGWFSAGKSYVKGILCIYAYHQPKSFIDNSIVHINNDWLKQANSKNYHHFFPKAYLEKKDKNDWRINHVLNITIVDDHLNKREIKAKAPSVYMSEFKKKNPNHLNETMKTHLIDDLDSFGVWNDNYDVFFEKRAHAVSKEIAKRIILQEIDKTQQPEIKEEAGESERIE